MKISRVPFCIQTLVLSTTQCQLYLFHSSQKKIKSLTLLSMIVLCNGFLFGLRNLWQLAFHVSVAFLSTLLILNRKLLDRGLDCGVWAHTHTHTQETSAGAASENLLHEEGPKVGHDTWLSQASNSKMIAFSKGDQIPGLNRTNSGTIS